MNFKANLLLILPLYVLKTLLKYFSDIYRQNYNLLFQPSIEEVCPTLEDPEICSEKTEKLWPQMSRAIFNDMISNRLCHVIDENCSARPPVSTRK